MVSTLFDNYQLNEYDQFLRRQSELLKVPY